jgi:uncharacterized repeat protein (TIGR03803 family)
VYKLNTDGTGFTVLKDFTGPDGANPFARLALSGDTLYGTTTAGGTSNLGTVFRVNTDGTGFGVLKNFAGPDGARPQAGLVVWGTNLFGCTVNGGNSNLGTLFKLSTDGNNYGVLHHFSGTEGASPFADLLFSDMTLYGVASSGGSSNDGVVFRLAVVPPTVNVPPQTQTAEVGATVDFGVGASGSLPLYYKWYFNETSPIGEGPNCGLRLADVQPEQAGAYWVVVTNVLGTATSAPAMLSVIPAVPRSTAAAINLTGEVGSQQNVEYTDSLDSPTGWLSLGNVNLTSTPQLFFDLTTPLPPQRFYRSWQSGALAAPGLLYLGFAQAITLTGNVGDKLRVDCINRFGPTDAWWTLDTVTLTNTSQLYFDQPFINGPQRLYRVVAVSGQ